MHSTPNKPLIQVASFDDIVDLVDNIIELVREKAPTPDGACVALAIALGRLSATYGLSLDALVAVTKTAYDEVKSQPTH